MAATVALPATALASGGEVASSFVLRRPATASSHLAPASPLSPLSQSSRTLYCGAGSQLPGAGREGEGKGRASSSCGARGRALELAFKRFLEHRAPPAYAPENFLRKGQGARSGMRAPPAPALNVLTDTCPAVVRRRLRDNPPPGMRCVFYSQHERGETQPGCLNPSRFHAFRREHSPSRPSFAPLRRRSPSPPRGGGAVRPGSAPCGASAAGGGAAAARRTVRAVVAESKLVSSQLGLFDRRCQLTHPAEDDDADDIRDANAAAAEQESLLKAHERLYLQGAFAATANRSSSPAGELLFLKGDPCESAGEVARAMRLVKEVKRTTSLPKAANLISLPDAKAVFARPTGLGQEFVIRNRQFREAMLQYPFDKVLTPAEATRVWRLFEHPLSDDQDRWMNGEHWLLTCHFIWRSRAGDREALLKTLFALLCLRADREGGRDRVFVYLSELQLATMAYRAKRRKCANLLAAIDDALVFGLHWEPPEKRMIFAKFVDAIAKHPQLQAAFVGHSDGNYVHQPRKT